MMPFKNVGKSFLVSAIATAFLGAVEVSSVNAAQDMFKCENINDLPTTTLQIPAGAKPFFIWNSGYFADSGYSDLVRCIEVTGRLNKIFLADSSPLLTYGEINELPVICTSDVIGGNCTELVYTLKPNQNPEEVFDSIIAFDTESIDTKDALYESLCPRFIHIDEEDGEIEGTRACGPKKSFVQRIWNSLTSVFQ